MRAIFAAKGDHGRALLGSWLAWAASSQLEAFVKPAKTIEHYKPLIANTLEHGLSNECAEATNTRRRTLTRRPYRYHNPETLIATATLTRGGRCPPLPGQN
jgi:transposase